MSSRLGLSTAQADRLTVRLLIDDALKVINAALVRRKAHVFMEYRGDVAAVFLGTAATGRQLVMRTQAGFRAPEYYVPSDPTLSGLWFELRNALVPLKCRFFMVIQKHKDQARYSKLQLFFEDSRTVTATLMETRRNTTKIDTGFTL